MVDTVSLYLPTLDTGCVLPNLCKVSQRKDLDSNKVIFSGNLFNLKVTVYDDAILVKNSLQKFSQKNNLGLFSAQQVKEALECVSDSLHLPMFDAVVRRVDIGVVGSLPAPLSAYLHSLGNVSRFERRAFRTGTQYVNRRKTLQLYDPLVLMKRNREHIPNSAVGRFLARVELQHKKEINQQFRRILTGKELFSDRFFQDAKSRLTKAVASIRPEPRMKKSRPFRHARNIHEMNNLCILGMVRDCGGVSNALDDLRDAKTVGHITHQQYNHMKVKIDRVAKSESLIHPNESLIELQNSLFAALDSYL